MVGSDRVGYNRWGIDPARPDVWSDWQHLGGSDLNVGIGLGATTAGTLDL